MLVVAFVVVLTFIFSHLTLFHTLEAFSQNLEARLRYHPGESDLAIVKITDDDYQKLFQGKSPLDTSALEHLISAIAEGKPKLIGVDIDTSDPKFKDFRLSEWWPPVVWQRELRGDPNLGVQAPMDVLGGKDPKLNESSGLAVLIDTGEDKTTRGYTRLVNSTDGPLPSFSWTLVKRLHTETTIGLEPSDEALEILYTDDPVGTLRFSATASRVLELHGEAGWRENSPIKDKIVILGGSYLLQDRHHTPLGEMIGAEVMANVVETELRGGGYNFPRPVILVSLELIVGVVVGFMFYRFEVLKGLLLGVLVAIPLSILCGLIAYGTFVRFYRFAPTVFVVFAFQGFEECRTKAWKGVFERLKV